MPQVYKGRFTARASEDFVVFIVGMRVNRWWMLHKWISVFLTMPRVLRRLKSEPALGMLHAESFFRFFPMTTCMITYWKDFSSLENFAKNSAEPHVAAWTRYMKKIGADGTVGIWHETYQIRKGQYESVYDNMPKFGLAAAFNHTPVTAKLNSAKQRIEDPVE